MKKAAMKMFVLRGVAAVVVAGLESYAGRWGEADIGDVIPAFGEQGRVAELMACLRSMCPCRG